MSLRVLHIAFSLLFLFFSVSYHAQVSFEELLKQNNSESRLTEFKDSEFALKLKFNQLQEINKSRKKHGAQPVALDILASRVANKMCKETAENNYLGHWNMAGETPYQRYAFAGGLDHIAENAASRSLRNDKFLNHAGSIADNMKSLHALFMAERAPHDGHKRNCIDPNHNAIGIGYYFTDTEFRYYEEYIDRYLEFEGVPLAVKSSESFHLNVKTTAGQYLYYLCAYYEPMPKPMKPKEIMRRKSYNDFTEKEVVSIEPWTLASFKNGKQYSIPLSFKRAGLYYIHIFVSEKDGSALKHYDTRGKTPVSGIVIRVD